MSKWSDALVVKTAPATVENVVARLREHQGDAELCRKALEQLEILGMECNYHYLLPFEFTWINSESQTTTR